MTDARRTPLTGFAPDGYPGAAQALDELEELVRIQAPAAMLLCSERLVVVRGWMRWADSLLQDYIDEEGERLGLDGAGPATAA